MQVAMGGGVYKLTLTDNVTNFKQMNIKVDYDSSVKQSALACKILGVKEITDFEPVECTKLQYNKEIMQRVEKIIYDLKIDTLIIHFNHDMQQDHVEASKICMTAGRHCDNILMYQSNGYVLDAAFYPNYFVDISDVIDKKILALQQYGDEHNRFDKLFQMNVERNHTWGYANHVEYAEGFYAIKLLKR